MRATFRGLLLSWIFLNAAGPLLRAHNGPPFPILTGRQTGPWKVTVWANPDVGLGSFFVMVDPAPGASIPSDLKVAVAVQPVGGRLREATYPAERQDLRSQVQYQVQVPFDKQEFWRIRILLSSPGAAGVTETTVEVTPVGLGRWDLLLYLLPFLGLGLVWARAFLRRRRRDRQRLREA